jgi:hypothetical protein
VKLLQAFKLRPRVDDAAVLKIDETQHDGHGVGLRLEKPDTVHKHAFAYVIGFLARRLLSNKMALALIGVAEPPHHGVKRRPLDPEHDRDLSGSEAHG